MEKYERSILDVVATLNSEQKGTLEGLYPDERKRLVEWLRWRLSPGVWDEEQGDRAAIDRAIYDLAWMLIDSEDDCEREP